MFNKFPLVRAIGLLHILFAVFIVWIWWADFFNMSSAIYYIIATSLFLLLGISIILLKIKRKIVFYVLPTILTLIELNAIFTTLLFGLITTLIREIIYQGILISSIVFIFYVLNKSKEKRFFTPQSKNK